MMEQSVGRKASKKLEWREPPVQIWSMHCTTCTPITCDSASSRRHLLPRRSWTCIADSNLKNECKIAVILAPVCERRTLEPAQPFFLLLFIFLFDRKSQQEEEAALLPDWPPTTHYVSTADGSVTFVDMSREEKKHFYNICKETRTTHTQPIGNYSNHIWIAPVGFVIADLYF